MSNENTVKVKRDLIIKITIPVLIIFIIAGIWILKNSETNKNNTETPNNTSKITDANPNFALLVTKKLDIEKLKSYGLPIIIDFGADSCVPCKLMAPVLKELNAELQGKAIIKFVDVWKYQSFAEGYPISVIPTQVLFDSKGNPYTPKDPNAIKLNMYTSKDTNEHIFTTHEGGLTKEEILAMLKEMGLKE
jgi:thioredoxin 1